MSSTPRTSGTNTTGFRPHLSIAFASLVLTASGCSSTSDGFARVRDQGFIRAGYSMEPPFAFVDGSGRVSGESAEALRAAMTGIGVDSVRWVLLEFPELIPALQQGRVDVVAAGMFVTDERRTAVRFSRPTVCSRPALVRRGPSGDPIGLSGFRDREGSPLAVIAGSVEEVAAELIGLSAARILAVPDVESGLEAVRSGAAGALALSVPSARRALGGSTFSEELVWEAYEPSPAVARLVEGCSALAFRPQDEGLTIALDGVLATYVGSETHRGVLAGLDFGRDDLPPTVSDGDGGGA